jgi:hypothetical protein
MIRNRIGKALMMQLSLKLRKFDFLLTPEIPPQNAAMETDDQAV